MAIDVKATNGAASPPAELMQAIADRKERPKPWVDADSFPWRDEEFSARYVRRANYQALYGMQETGEEVDALCSLLACGPKASVLDLCSGNGRHAVAMALRGRRATGIDVGPGAVQLARETAKNLGLSVDFRLLDVKRISFEDAYDGAFLACAGFSDFSPDDGAQILAIVGRALVPGGRFVFEYADAALANPHDERSWQFVSGEQSMFHDGPHLQLDERIFDKESNADVFRHFVVPADGHVREFSRCRQYYTEDTLKSMVAAAHLEPIGASVGSASGFKRFAAKRA
jgi:SAM-dependent methyltransferase